MNFRKILTVDLVFLIVISLIGAGLRFWGITNQSLWCDELASWDHGNYASVAEVMNEAVKPDLHPPGYHLLMYWVIKWWGNSEKVLRLPSVIAGILTIPAMYWLGKRIYGKQEGVIAAGLVAVTWAPVYYSQEARAYSLMLLLTVAGSYWWMEILNKWKSCERVRAVEFVGYWLTAVGLTYLHYYGFFWVGLQAIAALAYLRWKKYGLGGWLALYGSVGMAHLWWWPILVFQFRHNSHMITWISRPTVTIFVEFVLWLFNNSPKLTLVVMLVMVWWLGINLSKLKSGAEVKKQFGSAGMLLGLWLWVPITIAYIASQLVTPAMALRNFIISLPAAYLLVARAINKLTRFTGINLIVGMGIVLMFLYQLVGRDSYYTKQTKEQYRQATQFITNNMSGYPGAVIVGYEWVNRHFNYYLKEQGNGQRVEVLAGETTDINKLEQYLEYKRPKYFWYIRAHRLPEPDFMNYLDRDYKLVLDQPFIGARVWLYQTSYN